MKMKKTHRIMIIAIISGLLLRYIYVSKRSKTVLEDGAINTKK